MPNDLQRAAWTDISGPRWVAQRDLYDRMLLPFQAAVVEALAPRAGERVLDAGCGYGSTTLAVADRTGDESRVHGVDISPVMIAHARERTAGRRTVTFAVADAQTDRFDRAAATTDGDDGRYDAMVSRFGVMFFDDPTAAFTNIARAIRPGGRMAFVCWQAATLNPFFTMGRHIRALIADPPPLPDPTAPGPAAFADPGRAADRIEAAGWVDVDFRSITPTIGFDFGDDGIDNALKLVVGSEAGVLAERYLSPAQRDDAFAAVRADLAGYIVDGAIALPAAAWIVTGRIPG